MMLRCPLCGCRQYEKEGKYFRCTGCTVMFTDVKKFYSGGRLGAPVYGGRHESLKKEEEEVRLPEYYK